VWRLLLLLGLTSPVLADDSVRRETIVVGQSVERDVGYAIGVVCDDPDPVGAEMKTAKSADNNILVLTGKRAGKTTCRAGTDPHRVSFVFEIIVTPKPPAPRRP